MWHKFLIFIERWGNWTDITLSVVITVLSFIYIAQLPSYAKWIISILVFIAFIYKVIYNYKIVPEIENLNKDIQKLKDDLSYKNILVAELSQSNSFLCTQMRNTLKGYVISLAQNLFPKFTNKELTDTERLNIYLFNEKDHSFTLEARYCTRPEHCNSKNKYDFKKGCIYKAWEQGFYFDRKFPDDPLLYQQYVEREYNITPDELKLISKHSKLYAAIRIDNSAGQGIGVLLFESENKGFITKKLIKQLMYEQKVYLYQILCYLKAGMTSTAISSFEGRK